MNPFLLILLLLAALAAVSLLTAWAKGFSFRETRHTASQNRSRKGHHRHAGSYLRLRDLPWPQRLRLSCAMLFVQFMPRESGGLALANFNSAEHLDGKISYVANANFAYSGASQRFLVCYLYEGGISIGTAANEPLGICTDAPIEGDTASVDVFGAAPGTKRAIAAAAIAQGADIYTAANGLVQTEPTVAGTYWLIGTALMAATGAGDDIEFTSCKPVKLVVIAALTSAQNATAAAVDLPTSEALANALKASYNALQADVASIATAAATPALIKIL